MMLFNKNKTKSSRNKWRQYPWDRHWSCDYIICSTTLNLKTRLQIYISFCIPISSYFYTNSCKSTLNHTIQCLQTSNWDNWQTSNWDNWQTSNWS